MAVSRTRMGFIYVVFFLLILTPEVTCEEPDIRDLLQNLQNLLGKKNEGKVDNPSSGVQETQNKAQNKPEDVGESKSDQLLAELKKGLAMEKQSRVILEETVDQLKRRFLAGEFANLDEAGTGVLSKSLQAFNRSLGRERIRGVNLEVKMQQLENRQKTVNEELEAERARGANIEVKVQQLENGQKTVNEELGAERTRGANHEVRVQQLESGQKTVKEELEAEKTNRGELEMSIRQMNYTLLSLQNKIPTIISKALEKVVMLKSGRAETSTAKTRVTTSPQKVFTGGVTVCPSGWSAFGSSCYYFQLSSKSLTGDGAGKECKEKHSESTLVSIETADEYNFLKNTLKGHHESVKSRISNGWMTSGRKVGGGFQWSATGAQLNFSAVKWTKGRPKSLPCVSLWPPNFDLSDVYCTAFSRQFICELALRSG